MSKRTMPLKGQSADTILSELKAYHAQDYDWRGGKLFCLIYQSRPDVDELIHKVYDMYFHENGLNPVTFPSLPRMETETVSMVGQLLGNPTVSGSQTSGGTESILLAVHAARERAREKQPHITNPTMVMPLSAHPAWNKAAHYFGLETVIVPLDKDYNADQDALRKAVDDRTVLIVGSASNYPYGTIDPIPLMGQLAKERDICCHVDACVGGMMLPFLERLGQKISPWDFRVEGVTSISADLHKYGYLPKGTSVVLYRDSSYRLHQYYAYADWPGGVYATPNMTGSRPAAPIAATWAVLNYLGIEGYTQLAADVLDTRNRMMEGVRKIPGLKILGNPEMTIFAFGSDTLNMFHLGELLEMRGWKLERQQNPASIHLTITSARPPHVIDQFVKDVAECAELTETDKDGAAAGAAAIYGMLSTLPDRSMARGMALNFLDGIFEV